MNYLKKLFSFFARYNKVKAEKKSYAISSILQVELVIVALLLFFVVYMDIWIYRNMVSRAVETSEERVSTIEILHKKIVTKAAEIIVEHENKLNNLQPILIKSPF